MDKITLETIIKELEKASNDLITITQCLEVLENSLFFASERLDKDMSRPCAAAAEMIGRMVEVCQNNILEIGEKLTKSKTLEV